MIINVLILILVVILVMSALIVSHELGHFLVAKATGVWVEEFGLGLPPRIFGKKVGETIYSLNAFPIGGFVRLHGETPGEKVKFPERSFGLKSKKARAAIAIGGMLGNFVLAIGAFAVFYSFDGFPRESGRVEVIEVAADSPAGTAGIVSGDIVKAVDEIPVTTNDEFIKLVDERLDKRVKLTLTDRTVTLTPRSNPPEGQGAIGVVITSQEIYYPPVWQRPFLGVGRGIRDSLMWSGQVFLGLGQVAGDVSHGQVPKGVVGPFGILLLIVEIAKTGVLPLVNFVGIFAINLAIINILPIPPFDGSRLALIGGEAIVGKKVLPKVESTIYTVGFILVIVLFVLMTYREAVILASVRSISGFLEAILK